MKSIKIIFWKTFAKIWDLRPRKLPTRFIDYPIASCEKSDKYDYPYGVKILYEWDEKGRHWIVFSR